MTADLAPGVVAWAALEPVRAASKVATTRC